jgi:hypothetical protein
MIARFACALVLAGSMAVATADDTQAGKILFEDGSDCYHVSPYFKENNRATVSYYINGAKVQGPITLGRFSRYDLGPGRPGLFTVALPGTHQIRITCGSTTYAKSISNPLSIPSADIIFDNKSPKIKTIGIFFKNKVSPGYQEVKRVRPGSKLRLRFEVKEPGAGGKRPDHEVRSLYGTLTKVSVTKIDTNKWLFEYDWQLPQKGKGIMDVYASVDDGKGGNAEAGAKVNVQDGEHQLANAGSAKPGDFSKHLPQLDHFLTFFSTKASTYETQGADSAKSACAYYVDLGFAAACDGDRMTGGIRFSEWKENWGFLANPPGGSNQVRAIYANVLDLNLERDMNAIHNSNGAAFYVCNYPFDDPELGDGEPDLDLSRAIEGKMDVACVAMEYSVTPGYNSGDKFTKFLVFDAKGQLTRRVNLDGRGMKHIPGACVVCHGATSYSRYSDLPGTGDPAFGANFLPFDLDNYVFSPDLPYRLSDQQDEFRKLNNYVKNQTNPAAAIVEVIDGWYPTQNSDFDGSFVPPGWAGEEDVYTDVVKPFCRTCHVAMNASFNTEALFNAYASTINNHVCGAEVISEKARYSMPNSLVTLDKFWKIAAGGTQSNAQSTLAAYLRVALNQPSLLCNSPAD